MTIFERTGWGAPKSSTPSPRAPSPHAPRPRVSGRSSARLPYLPGLDGLRAIAVLAVVAYHLGWSAAPGGFLGVDVFFVLSGFLITSGLVEEHRTSGRVDLRRFFVRRVRRLVPALWAMLLVVGTTAALFVRDELGELRRDIPAALLYLSNWADLTDHQSYFQSVGRPPLLAHLWSLAIEGQFYAIWPVALMLLLRCARQRRLATIALVGAGLSTAAMALLASAGGYPIPNDPSPVYLASGTHAMGLLLGSAAGVVWAPWRSARPIPDAGSRDRAEANAPRSAAWSREAVGVAGLVGLVVAFARVTELSPALYRGGFAVVALLALATVVAVAHPSSRLGLLLGVQPLRYLGQRSYGIYLWHWPVLVLTRPGFELPFDGVASVALRLGLTLAFAEASYRWIELPVRRGALRRWTRRVPESLRAAQGIRRGRLIAGPVALVVLVAALGAVLASPPPALAAGGIPRSVLVNTIAAGNAVAASDEHAAGASPLRGAGTPWSADAARREAPAPAAPPAAPVPPAFPAPATPAAPAAQPAVAPPTTVVGDSVMAAIAPALTARFPAVEIDAVTSRQPAGVLAALSAISAAGRLGQVVVIGAGTNGAIAEGQLRAMLDLTRSARRVIVLNDYVERPWEAHNNELITAIVPQYSNAIVFDWYTLAAAHPEWLWTDRIHPRPAGADAIAAMFLDEAVRAPA